MGDPYSKEYTIIDYLYYDNMLSDDPQLNSLSCRTSQTFSTEAIDICKLKTNLEFSLLNSSS